MKKTYFSPEFETIKLSMKCAILEASGGGISDNGEAQTGSGGSTDPTEDYGW